MTEQLIVRVQSSRAAKLAGATAIGQGMVVLSMPLVTRLYGPESMGTFGALLAFVNFASVASTLRFDMAVVGARDDGEAARLAWGAALITLPTSIVLGFLMLSLMRGEVLGFGLLPDWAAALATMLLILTGVFTTLRFFLVRCGGFAVIGRSLLMQGSARAVVPVGAGACTSTWEGLAMGELVTRTMGIWGLWVRSRDELRPRMRLGGLREVCGTLWAHRRYPAVLLPSSVLDAAAVAVPLPLILQHYGAREAGLYLVVTRIIAVPTQLISGSFADVFHHDAQTEHESGKRLLRALIRTHLAKLLRIGAAVFLPTAVVSPFVFGRLFGAQFAESGWIFAVLAPAALAAFVVGPLSRALVVLGRPDLKLLADGVALLGATAPIYVAGAAGLGLLAAVAGLAAGSLAASAAYLAAIVTAAAPRSRS